MRLQKFVLLFLVLIFAVQFSIGQTNPSLIDQFSATNCCDEGARLDGLAIYLQENPKSKSFVVIYYDKNTSSISKFFKENRAKKYLYYNRGIEKDRITFLRGEGRDKYQIQLWVTDNLNIKPAIIESNWTYTLPKKRRYQFYTSENDFGPCDSAFSVELFGDFLSANPDKLGRIAISGNSRNKIQETKNQISKVLFDNYKIPTHRVKFFPIKNTEYPDYTIEEFWFTQLKK